MVSALAGQRSCLSLFDAGAMDTLAGTPRTWPAICIIATTPQASRQKSAQVGALTQKQAAARNLCLCRWLLRNQGH